MRNVSAPLRLVILVVGHERRGIGCLVTRLDNQAEQAIDVRIEFAVLMVRHVRVRIIDAVLLGDRGKRVLLRIRVDVFDQRHIAQRYHPAALAEQHAMDRDPTHEGTRKLTLTKCSFPLDARVVTTRWLENR